MWAGWAPSPSSKSTGRRTQSPQCCGSARTADYKEILHFFLFLSMNSWYWMYFLCFTDLATPWLSLLGFINLLCAVLGGNGRTLNPMELNFSFTLKTSSLRDGKALCWPLSSASLVTALLCVGQWCPSPGSWVALGNSNVAWHWQRDCAPCSGWPRGDAHHEYIPWD